MSTGGFTNLICNPVLYYITLNSLYRMCPSLSPSSTSYLAKSSSVYFWLTSGPMPRRIRRVWYSFLSMQLLPFRSTTLHMYLAKDARWQNSIPSFPWNAPGWRARAGAQSKERKGSNFAGQRTGATVLQARRAKRLQSCNHERESTNGSISIFS